MGATAAADLVEVPVIMEEDEVIVGCRSAFDRDSKCVVAVCKSCQCNNNDNDLRGGRMCKCRGRGMEMSAKKLSKTMIVDWNLGLVDRSDDEFDDLIFCLPVSCSTCNKFLSKDIELAVNQELQEDKARKLKTDPGWVARDWETLRKVIHNSWPEGN